MKEVFTGFTPEVFKEMFPEFGGVADDAVQVWLERSSPFFNVSLWGDLYREGLGYWIAANLALWTEKACVVGGRSAFQDGGDTYTQKEMGPMKFAKHVDIAKMQMQDLFMRTPYGQHYLHLQRLVAGNFALSF